ncbi:hypothetical protein L0Y69_01285 [bacterium]|nr:hypothetical protein [bacterium]
MHALILILFFLSAEASAKVEVPGLNVSFGTAAVVFTPNLTVSHMHVWNYREAMTLPELQKKVCNLNPKHFKQCSDAEFGAMQAGKRYYFPPFSERVVIIDADSNELTKPMNLVIGLSPRPLKDGKSDGQRVVDFTPLSEVITPLKAENEAFKKENARLLKAVITLSKPGPLFPAPAPEVQPKRGPEIRHVNFVEMEKQMKHLNNFWLVAALIFPAVGVVVLLQYLKQSPDIGIKKIPNISSG